MMHMVDGDHLRHWRGAYRGDPCFRSLWELGFITKLFFEVPPHGTSVGRFLILDRFKAKF